MAGTDPSLLCDPDFSKAIAGYKLTTASILYHMPDHPSLLQEFIWQEFDLLPRFPELRRFLHYWEKQLEGKLYRVRVEAIDKLAPAQWQAIAQEFQV